MVDQSNLRCTSTASTSLPLGTLEVCEEARGLVSADRAVLDHLLAPVIAGSVAVILVLLGTLVILVYRTQIKLWLYSRYGDSSIGYVYKELERTFVTDIEYLGWGYCQNLTL